MWKKEDLNTFLYGSKRKAYFSLRIFSILISILGFSLSLTRYGFHLNQTQREYIHIGWQTVLFCFLGVYLGRILYSFHRRDFIKRTWFEGSLMLITLFAFLLSTFHEDFLIIAEDFVGLYILFLSIFEFIKISPRINLIKFQPTTLFITSFLLLIGLGTIILMLPTVTTGPGSMLFIDALFTAVSASCVTGLVVVDTGTFFTLKGQILILILFQLGGLSIISFATFFSTLFPKSVGIKHQSIIKNLYSSESLHSAQGLFKQIITITVLIEGIIAIGIFLTWGDEVQFKGLGQKIFHSLFHAISAFCNAGFSLYTDGLMTEGIKNSYILHIIIAMAIIFGGLGFPVIQDVFSIRNLRERLAYPWKDWKISSKVAIYTSAGLILFGTIIFYFVEKNHALQNHNMMEGIITSFFQSVTTRTAGFNTLDFSQLQTPVIIVTILLMFIGASPASTGGGIKTTTFLLLVLSSIATIKESWRVEMGNRTIPNELLSKASSLFSFAVAFNFTGILVLSITEKGADILTIVFEQISAFGTVGLSMGLTSTLSVPGKMVIIISMFFGRVGLLTIALALSRRALTTSYRYPDAHMMIG